MKRNERLFFSNTVTPQQMDGYSDYIAMNINHSIQKGKLVRLAPTMYLFYHDFERENNDLMCIPLELASTEKNSSERKREFFWLGKEWCQRHELWIPFCVFIRDSLDEGDACLYTSYPETRYYKENFTVSGISFKGVWKLRMFSLERRQDGSLCRLIEHEEEETEMPGFCEGIFLEMNLFQFYKGYVSKLREEPLEKPLVIH